MNYIKEAEKYLYCYKDLFDSVKNMKNDSSKLVESQEPADVKGIDYAQTQVDENFYQDEAYNVLFKLQVLTENIAVTEEKLKEIDNILGEITKENKFYGPVLKKWYIERIPKEEIAKEIGYSSRQSIYSLRAKAIRKFAIRLFGLEALKMM